MKKIVISIISDLIKVDEESLSDLYRFFSDRNYTIEQFIDVGNEIQIDHLPLLIDQIKTNYSEQLSRVVVISNIKPLLLSWYRCYNTLTDDFVFFVNSDESTRNYSKQLDIVTFLSDLDDKSIEQEYLLGKIYFSNLNVDSGFGNFMLTNRRYRFFNSLANFSEVNAKPQISQKNYTFRKNDYFFKIPGVNTRKSIDLIEEVTHNFLTIDQNLLAFVEETDSELMFHLFHTISNFNYQTKQKYTDLNKLMELYSKFSINKQRTFYDNFKYFIKKNNISFKEKMSFFTVLVKLEGTKDIILQDIMLEIKNDTDHIQYHYPLVINSLFYISKEGVKKYPDVINDRMEIIERITNQYKPELTKKLKNKKETKKIKKIAIVTSQIISLKHSPSLLTLTIAKYLKRIDSSLEISIFVDDTYIHCKDELVFPNLYYSSPSHKQSQEHKEFLEGQGIKIKYSSPYSNRKSKIQNEVSEIIDFNPDVIYLMGADFSLRSWILAKIIPVVVMSMSPEPSNFKYGQIYTTKYDLNRINYNLDKFNIDNKRRYKQLIHMEESYNSIPKNIKPTIELNSDKFIIVTVGNRLDADIDATFLEIIQEFISKHQDVIWYLIGNAEHKLVRKFLKKEVQGKQVCFIPYEHDLKSFFKKCDVYINPFCEGNGRIGRLAASVKLPIISHDGISDISEDIGYERAVSKKDYGEELLRMYSSKEYRVKSGNEIYDRIEKRSPELWANQLLRLFNKLIEN
ncbi:hypothetical protein [Gracilibacillus xinjiangensis]|uniref:Glycosyltransferase n=1 Tax=Gracilibacillus xinjiangensis TaxID=1193282 RepID=A0ABV8WYR2_9BACI